MCTVGERCGCSDEHGLNVIGAYCNFAAEELLRLTSWSVCYTTYLRKGSGSTGGHIEKK